MSSIPRERIFHASFASLSPLNPQAGQERSRTHNGLSVETPHAAHPLVVPLGLTASKYVPLTFALYASNEKNVRHAAGAVLRLFEFQSVVLFARIGDAHIKANHGRSSN